VADSLGLHFCFLFSSSWMHLIVTAHGFVFNFFLLVGLNHSQRAKKHEHLLYCGPTAGRLPSTLPPLTPMLSPLSIRMIETTAN
jgi:hypothetical protein